MKYFLAAVAILFACQAPAAGWEESPQVGDLFRSAGVKGTFVLYDVTAQTYRGHDQARAEKRFVPASTFKIPNSLIGLSVGAVKSVDEVLPYQGPAQPFVKAWAQDMGLREAIALSNIPIYQELARRIGLDRMRESVAQMGYGNAEIGTTVDTFWLTGPLKISAVEQTQFLAKLAVGALPFPPDCQKDVREIILLNQGANWKLYGKTGWENAPDQGVGWWVGWVQKDQHIYAFALNMDMQGPLDANRRVELGKASLQALGLL
ncbi:class D beta-lactamase [Azonexus sp.]|jgi:beta-lactamase class D|uniref:class D beta-lactamase n=1 Tax=Azonexus sp. TaxID=1872668 RepID=UPI00282E60B1|nr:class D beta-lactamase [Azonexus sp.]MDR1996681.1 class D beta-lactamase [Azonexus sp.]